MPIDIDAIAGAMEMRLGLPRVHWTVIHEWAERHIGSKDLNEAYTELARQWLIKMCKALSAPYEMIESENFLVLSAAADARLNARLVQWCEYYRDVVLDTLHSVVCDEGYGKHILLAFADRDSYYDYVADSYPEAGEFGLSSGVFLDQGYGNIAICTAFGSLDRTIAHELTHAMLRHLPLPAWLNEGLAQVVEEIAVGSSHFLMDRELASRHRAYWTSETIQFFWSGESFGFADEGQELSYSLAQVLLRNLMSDYPRQTMDFVGEANYIDAGEAALRSAFNQGLADRVSQFLGSGAWQPRSDYSEPKAALRGLVGRHTGCHEMARLKVKGATASQSLKPSLFVLLGLLLLSGGCSFKSRKGSSYERGISARERQFRQESERQHEFIRDFEQNDTRLNPSDMQWNKIELMTD